MVMEATAESMEAMATIIGQVADLGPMSNTTPSRWNKGSREKVAEEDFIDGKFLGDANIETCFFLMYFEYISMLIVFSFLIHGSFISFDHFLTQERPHGHLFAWTDSQQRDGDERIQ